MNKLLKTVLALFVVLAMLIACVGCTGTQAPADAPADASEPAEAPQAEAPADGGEDAADGRWKIGLSTFSLTITWQIQTIDTLKAAVDAFGNIDFEVFNCDNDTATQITQIENMIADGYDAILIDASSTTGLDSVIKKAMDAGIVVVNYNCGIADPTIATSRIWVDQVEWGAAEARFIADSLNGAGKICMLGGFSGNQITEDRHNGAMEVFDQYPDIEILAEDYGEWAQAPSEAIMQQWVASFDQIDAVWCDSGAMAIGVLNVLKKNDMPLIPVTGEDSNGYLKIWIENMDSGFSGCGPACPEYIGQIALNAALKVLEGGTVANDIKLPLPVIYDDTVKDYVDYDASDEAFCMTKISQEEIDAILAN